MLLEFKDVKKSYSNASKHPILDGASFGLEPGAFAAIVGPSGSGKTTMLNLASGLDFPDFGEIRIDGKLVSSLTENELSDFRLRHLGFVFQAYNLFPSLTAIENVEFLLVMRGEDRKTARTRALEAMSSVGLPEKTDAFPNQLSGGQQQRVAVARALAGRPKLIFADEPTANLDARTAVELMELFVKLNRENGTTFLFSTHDMRLVERVTRKLTIVDRQIVG